jgi:hypothetical protein
MTLLNPPKCEFGTVLQVLQWCDEELASEAVVSRAERLYDA